MDFRERCKQTKKKIHAKLYLARKDSKLRHCVGSQSKQQIVRFGFINQQHSGS